MAPATGVVRSNQLEMALLILNLIAINLKRYIFAFHAVLLVAAAAGRKPFCIFLCEWFVFAD